MFPCDKCGICCRHVGKIVQLKHLALSDGVCRYLDQESNLCMIYDSRPLHCNVEAYYYKYMKDAMSIDEFYEMNSEYCQKLKNSSGEKRK